MDKRHKLIEGKKFDVFIEKKDDNCCYSDLILVFKDKVYLVDETHYPSDISICLNGNFDNYVKEITIYKVADDIHEKIKKVLTFLHI